MNTPVQTDKTPTPLTNRNAKDSLVFGILSGLSLVFGYGGLVWLSWPNVLTDSIVGGGLFLFIVVFVMSLIAISDGYKARRQIKESLGTQTGDSLAVTGLIIGYVNIVIMGLVLFIALIVFILPTAG